MNYLAHLYLARFATEDTPQALIGNLMGDFVKGPIPDDLAPALRQGIWLHRRVDRFTDDHPLFRRSKRRIAPAYRRYAGILIDVFYDHLLATRWPRYADEPLEHFVDRVHAVLRQAHPTLPPRMQRSVGYLLNNNLLLSYRHPAGVERALRGLENRLKRPSNLGRAAAELTANRDGLDDDFGAFFPDLIGYVEGLHLPPTLLTQP